MKTIVVLPCECGREIRATNPAPGSIVRCFYCGNSRVYQPDGSTADNPPHLSVPGDPQPDLTREPMICNMCGGKIAIKYSGPKGADRMAVCSYCGTKTDLPESRGRTKVTESRSPDGTVTKTKETKWESMSGNDGAGIESFENMKRHLLKNLPRDMVDHLMKDIDR